LVFSVITTLWSQR